MLCLGIEGYCTLYTCFCVLQSILVVTKPSQSYHRITSVPMSAAEYHQTYTKPTPNPRYRMRKRFSIREMRSQTVYCPACGEVLPQPWYLACHRLACTRPPSAFPHSIVPCRNALHQRCHYRASKNVYFPSLQYRIVNANGRLVDMTFTCR